MCIRVNILVIMYWWNIIRMENIYNKQNLPLRIDEPLIVHRSLWFGGKSSQMKKKERKIIIAMIWIVDFGNCPELILSNPSTEPYTLSSYYIKLIAELGSVAISLNRGTVSSLSYWANHKAWQKKRSPINFSATNSPLSEIFTILYLDLIHRSLRVWPKTLLSSFLLGEKVDEPVYLVAKYNQNNSKAVLR